MRIYDPRLGRFLSADPIGAKYPELTPYQFASNRPIDGVDQDGKEWQHIIASFKDVPKLKVINVNDGWGPVVKATYNLKVHGSIETFDGLKDIYTRDPGILHNMHNKNAFYTPLTKAKTISEGDHMKITVATGIVYQDIYVRFAEVNVTKNSFYIKAKTLEGHTDAGFITFSGEFDPASGVINFTIHNETTNNVGVDIVKLGRYLQTKQWKLILNNVEQYLKGNTISKTMDKETGPQEEKKGDKIKVEHEDLIKDKDTNTEKIVP